MSAKQQALGFWRGFGALFGAGRSLLGMPAAWPYALVPAYWVLERIPATRETARRLGLVTVNQIVRALVSSVETPVETVRILGVPEMRDLKLRG